MSAPPNFDPHPMGRDTQPAPAPPRYLKHQIYADPRVFKHIDDHAINEARTNYRNFKDLIWNLIYKKNFNDLEKVRAIFRWMTTKNMYTIMFDSELPGSPEAVLGGFKDGGTTYARIFECLCVYAGLHCLTLSGWAKGVEYRPGNPITSGPINHSWNAVLIDGNWQLVDSHWATRYLQSERNTPENLVYEYDDFYFLTEPSQLIYSHCPEDPSCQLLYPARSRAEFEEYPLVKSFFFTVGMQFHQQNQGVLHTRKGILVLSLGFTRPTAFTFKLGIGDAVIETMQGIQLKRYVIQETGENRVSFYLRAPKEGNYFLTLYAQAVGDRLKVENVFKAVCEYKVVCEQAAGDTRPYPLCSDSNWGPGAPVRQYGLVPSHKDAILTAPNGRAEVSFTKTRDTRLYAKLTREGMDEDTLERCVSVREQDDKVFVTIQLPTRGEYGLEIYANEPDREGDTFTHVCQYLASYIDRDPGSVYGQAFDKADFTYGQVSGPVIYPSRAGQFANQDGNKSMGGPPGKQVYQTSSQDWEGNMLTHQSYRSETEAVPGGIRTVTQSQDPRYYGYAGHDPNKTTMYSGRPGEEDGLPPPPPELMAQSYANQTHGAPPGSEDYPPPPYNSTRRGQSAGVQFFPGKGQAYGQDNMDSPYGASPYGPNGYQGYQGSPADSPYGTAQRRPNDSDDNKNKGVEVVYVPGGRSPYGSLGRPVNKPVGGKGKDGQPGSVEIIYTPGQKSAPPPTAPKPGRTQEDRYSGLRGFRAPATTYESGEGGQAGRPGDSTRYVPIQVDGGRGGPGGPGEQYDQQRMQAGGQAPLEAYPFGSEQYGGQDFAQRPSEPEKEYQPHEPKVYTSTITVEPPTSFRPVPINQDQAAPKPAPPAVPPKPFKDTKVFQDVDTHAVEVSKEEHKSFRDLVWHLIYARDITNELEKARAIFLWLCSKDLAQLNFNDVKKGSPEEILINLQRGQTTYAVVYETLCSYAGLHCKTISGYAKGAEYKPGMRFTGEQGQHSWNGVLVEGAWRLVDCHWAARRLVGKKVTPENVRYELDEYYFMPDPHQLIFTHFPDDGSWQLLERPIQLTDFENLVPVKSAFFKYGLQILSHREAVIHTNREVTIRVGCPPFKSDMLAFTFTLAYDDGREEYKDIKLNRFGMQEMLDNVSYFTIRPPEQGSYRLILYAKDLTQQSKEGVYGGVCEYEVIAEGTSPSPQPFPPCVHTSWGPGDSAHKYHVKPLQRGAIFSTVNGQAEVKFRLPKELRFTAKLKSDKKDEKALSGYIMHRVVGDLAIFTITAPDADEYGLEIYANDPESDGNSLYHCFQYLLICTEVKGPVEALPTLPPGYLGPQPNFKKLGLSNTSHTDPYLQTDSGDIQVSFSMSQPLRMTSQLIYVSQGKTEDFSDYLLQQGRGNNVIFRLKLPKVGMYKFQIYALPFSDTSESLPGVYNYLINCRMTHATLIQFPKQYGQWKEGCYLHEPLEGQLQANRPSKGSASSFQYYYFMVDVPKANSVAVVIGDDWTQLEQKASGSWEGEVFMEKHWGKENKAALCANYGTTKASYSTLLEYSM